MYVTICDMVWISCYMVWVYVCAKGRISQTERSVGPERGKVERISQGNSLGYPHDFTGYVTGWEGVAGAPAEVYNVESMVDGPLEILQVRADRQTLLIRVPPFWAKLVGLEKGDFVVARPADGGGVVLRKFESEVNHGADIGGDRAGADQGRRIPDEVGGGG